MNRARDDFLAGARLARNENRARRRGDRFEKMKELQHHRALADDSLEAVPLIELCAEIRVLRLQSPLLERRIERVEEFVDLKGLADKIRRAALDGFHRVLDRSESGDDDGDDVGVTL